MAQNLLIDHMNQFPPLSMPGTVIGEIPARLFCKDLESNYLGCNTLFAKDAGFSSPNEPVEMADVLRKEAESVLQALNEIWLKEVR